MPARPRIVIASPNAVEREALADWLGDEGLEPASFSTAGAAVADVGERPFDLLIADVAFAFRNGLHAAARGRARHAATPTLVIGEPEALATRTADARTMYVERPIDRAALVCTVAMLMMEARPARRSPRTRVHFDALVDGVPASIIDISNEGLRLEVPRTRRWAPPPYYRVRVPILGVGLMVQRMWTTVPSHSTNPEVSWCGGALAENAPRADRAWRAFVDAVGNGPASA